jgi:tetratricopeptide (TPR) repeat protein
MSLPRTAWIGVIATACIGVAVACGPNFPWQLFDSRSEAVSEPIGLGFEAEAKRLVPAPRGALDVVESDEPLSDPEAVIAERQEAQSGAWKSLVQLGPQALADRLGAARRAADGEAALTAGVGLPVAVVTYIAGAIEFRAGRLESAAKYFEEIGRLPAGERRVRAVAAAYMRGRVHQKRGDAELARRAFRATRAAAQTGAPDPMGLAVASLGEQARVDLVAAGLVSLDPNAPVSPPVQLDDVMATKLIGDAVQLYAEQAARGSKLALLSLREVAASLMDNPDAMGAAVASPIVRRLLVTYAIARDGQSVWGDLSTGDDVQRVIDAVLTQPVPAAGEDVDRLAALAYQTAHYDVAGKLTEKASRPLGLWVRAKLALRRGDRTAAVKDWSAALGAIDDAASKDDLDPVAAIRLRGETAVMKVAQGDYQDSLRLLFPVAQTYWGDVAYIAERVLTVDELKKFVDALPPVAPAAQNDDRWFGGNPAEGLRTLLGRRLIREGRNAEAIAYFPTTPPKSFNDPPEKTRPLADEARDYVAAVGNAQPTSWWRGVTRAEALFKLSTMTRRRGMEVMGTEGPPDETVLDGAFSGGVGQSAAVDESDQDPQRLKANLALLGPDEKARVAASAAKPDIRFHYRVLAADKAIAAADLLPQRSQAYAATLCWAARFAKDSDDLARVTAIYKRYVATGAYQPWASAFGETCPEPDFAAARDFWLKRIVAWPADALRAAGRHPGKALGIVAVAGLLLAGLAFAVRVRRRQPVA